ncbi:MAG: glycyl-radical enzyme activating protein [Rectinemataceae bacterium]|jgi:pyruvate formate lyase activating enzyme
MNMAMDSQRVAEPSAQISAVQRYCVHDGPGIRTVVFFLGCPLCCRWCQNPEALEGKPVLMFNLEKCVGCGACIEACPEKANSLGEDGKAHLDRSRCTTCGDCVDACYYEARELSGKPYSVAALLQEVLKDEVVFRNSGGGVTLSGGEPLCNPAFAEGLLRACGRRGVHTAVETCGSVPWGNFQRVLPHVDLFLYDLKLVDPARHEEWTGSSNRLVLENARRLAELGKRIFVRVPLIPGVNDDKEEFTAIARFAVEELKADELHILPFHQIGSSKYELVGREYSMREAREDNEEGVARCRSIAEARGLRVSVGGTGFRNAIDDRRVARYSARNRCSFLYDIEPASQQDKGEK